MAVHGRSTHNPATLDLVKGHQRPQGDLLKPLLVRHVGLNQIWISLNTRYERIARGTWDVILNSHQRKRIHGDKGYTTQLP